MALLFIDSFDHYATADLPTKWSSVAGSATISAGNGRRGSACLRTVPGGFAPQYAGVAPTVSPSGAVCVVGVAFRFSALAANGLPIIAVRDGTNYQATLVLSTSGQLQVRRGAASGTLLGSGSTLSAATYVYLEFKVVIHASAGTVDVRVNGASVLSLTGQNTQGSSTTTWASIRLGDSEGAVSSGPNLDFDDLYVLDGSGSAPLNDVLGDCRVDARAPTAAGATTGWTPSAGANWQNVDDATPNGDTDYNSTPTSGAIDTFTTQDVAAPGAAIYGVQVCLDAKKSDAGVCTVAPVVRHAGTNNVGATLSPSTSYTYLSQAFGTNPGTGAAWTETDFNAAEFGYKRLS